MNGTLSAREEGRVVSSGWCFEVGIVVLPQTERSDILYSEVFALHLNIIVQILRFLFGALNVLFGASDLGRASETSSMSFRFQWVFLFSHIAKVTLGFKLHSKCAYNKSCVKLLTTAVLSGYFPRT